MWNLAIPWWELIVRSVVVYLFLIVILRITGKRQVGQLAPFDLVLLLVLSNAVQNSMNGGDNSLIGGLISAATLIALNYAVGTATFRSKKLEALIEGRPEVLIHNGKLYEDVLTRAQLTRHELNAALRQSGCTCVEEVHTAVLENNGQISVTPKSKGTGRTPPEPSPPAPLPSPPALPHRERGDKKDQDGGLLFFTNLLPLLPVREGAGGTGEEGRGDEGQLWGFSGAFSVDPFGRAFGFDWPWWQVKQPT